MISLRLTDAQIVSFNEVFQTLFERSRKGTGNEMNSSVVRMATISDVSCRSSPYCE